MLHIKQALKYCLIFSYSQLSKFYTFHLVNNRQYFHFRQQLVKKIDRVVAYTDRMYLACQEKMPCAVYTHKSESRKFVLFIVKLVQQTYEGRELKVQRSNFSMNGLQLLFTEHLIREVAHIVSEIMQLEMIIALKPGV